MDLFHKGRQEEHRGVDKQVGEEADAATHIENLQSGDVLELHWLESRTQARSKRREGKWRWDVQGSWQAAEREQSDTSREGGWKKIWADQ